MGKEQVPSTPLGIKDLGRLVQVAIMELVPRARPELVELPELIGRRIHLVRGQKMIFDFDIAELYEVSTKALNQAVKRNMERFPTTS